MDAISTHNLSKVYRALGRPSIHSLSNLNLSVRDGEIFGFLGRNGAGKTTTIKLLCSLIKPTAGEAHVLGENVRTRAARRLFGYLPEQPYFYEYLTPRETLDFYGRVHGLSHDERLNEWDKLSEWLELRGIAEQRIKSFSKGMRQRIGFAVALVGDPRLLILDEPMSGLDPIGRRNIRDLIVRMRELKKTVFFSSHVLGDVELICNRIGILVKGKLTKIGPIDELIDDRVGNCEVVAEHVPPDIATALAGEAIRHHARNGLQIFLLENRDAANGALRRLIEAGATIVQVNPAKTQLEDYFIREQGEGGA